jgi:molybdenum cofactor cytidylyltransferase
VNLAGLILCGGASRRMGTAKALLDFRGQTFLDRLIGLLGACCDSVTVVLGHEPDTVLAGIRRAPEARFVVNAQYESGQLSSLQCGLRAMGSADAVMFTPVDHPAVEESTAAALAAAIRGEPDELLLFVPRFQGKRGHPVGIRSTLLAEFLALGPGASAREVIHRHRGETRYVDVPDRGILWDVDDPEAYRLLRAEHAP